PVPESDPKIVRGITAATVTEALAPAARLALLAVRRSPALTVAVPKLLEVTVQVSRSGSGSWSVTTTLLAGPAPSLLTVMVKEAVSPGWMTTGVSPGAWPVTALVIDRCGSSVTLADARAWMTLLKLPRFWARVNAT